MFAGKMKAITFSFDDGVTQDRRLVDLFNKYHLKCTFNINSELLGTENSLIRDEKFVLHNKVQPDEVRELYAGHEVAAHTLTHPRLTTCSDEEIIRQVEQDRLRLSELVGYEVLGMAYPGGGVNHDDRVVDVIQKNTGIAYARTVTSTGNFDLQEDLLRFKPSAYILEPEQMVSMGKAFLELQPEKPQLFYIWGHSYEFDYTETWEPFEEFCAMISNREDIFYGTNREVLLGK